MIILRILKYLSFALFNGSILCLLLALAGYIYYLQNRADLKPWHTANLDAEFSIKKDTNIKTLEDYIKLESRLFEQLQQLVYDKTPATHRQTINRYSGTSPMNPENFAINWNRTFELSQQTPDAGVLLLHGLSDSPYSMRAFGSTLHEQNYWVLGLRIPGHGTAPSGLLNSTWQDFTAATQIAVRHLRHKMGPDKPIYIIGYSNGAALAVHYALLALENDQLPKPKALVLLSPAIAVTPLAGLAIWQERLSSLTGLDKLSWTDIQPEFDPYKYNSFTVNAGKQIYQLTNDISKRLEKLSRTKKAHLFPQTLAFVSIVDATIPPVTLIDAFFNKLPANNHQLVIFDVNRHSNSEQLMRSDPDQLIKRLLEKDTQPYQFSLLSNLSEQSKQLVIRNRMPDSMQTSTQEIELRWPQHIFSLSHVALPFPPDDPIYGGQVNKLNTGSVINLGGIWIRGERNLLQIPDNYFLRLRYNPFFSYLKNRTLNFLHKANNSS